MNVVEIVLSLIKERNAKITKKLWEAMLIINNNLDTNDPAVMAAIEKIADAVRELDEVSSAIDISKGEQANEIRFR